MGLESLQKKNNSRDRELELKLLLRRRSNKEGRFHLS